MADAAAEHSVPSGAAAPGILTFAAVILAVTLVRLAVLTVLAIPLSMDEAQYWIWSRALDFGYYSKPPMIAWLIGATTSLCGDGEACVRATSPILHAATSFAVFAIGNLVGGPRLGWWSGLAFTFLPGIAISAMIMSTDVPLLLAWSVALFCLIRALDGRGMGWWIGLGAAFGLGLMAKYAMLFFVLGLVTAVLWSPRVRAKVSVGGLVSASIIGALIYAPNFVWNLGNGFVSYRHTSDNIAFSEAVFDLGHAGEFILTQFGVVGPVMFGALLVCAYRAVRHPQARDDADTLLLSFSLPILILIVIEAFVTRAHANWAATAYVAGTIFLCRKLLRTGAVRWLQGAFAVNFAASVLLFNAVIADAYGYHLPRALDAVAKTRGWDEAGPWVRDLRRRYPGAVALFDNRTDMASLIYYARPLADDAVMWNPWGGVHNHFELTTDPRKHPGGDFIYITRRESPSWILPSFEAVTPLGEWQTSAYPGHHLRLRAYLAEGFRGYRP
ncbi:MAG: glycosyltransferase family 39 protein [Rhodobacteraceae bacterium]|nr:glycosyltransferase family 39 protein [Paracoccaceae bacterium]